MAVTVKNQDAALRLLLVDAAENDAARVLACLTAAGTRLQAQRVATAAALRDALRNATWDALLCRLPHPAPRGAKKLGAPGALRLLQDAALDLPFILLADSLDDKAVTHALQAGAHEVFAWGELERLLPAIRREIRAARHRADHRAALEMLRASETRFRVLAANLPGMVFQLEYDPASGLHFSYVSDGCDKLIGLKPNELLSAPQRFVEVVDTADRAALDKALEDSAATCSMLNWEGRIRKRGQVKWINLRSTPQRLDNGGMQWQGIATDISRSKEAEAKLRRSREQLSELSYHLEAAKEEERERIARDIHDELGSTLVAIKIKTALLSAKLPEQPPGLRDMAGDIEGMLDQAMSTVGRVARELRPGILKEFGLSAALECQAEDFSQRTGIACRVQCDDEGAQLDEQTSVALFRIFQEALTNVAKHAHASLVVVRLRREKGCIVLEIRDNGRGISEADLNKPRSFGLRGIRERINSLNGEFAIGPAEPGGSHIMLSVPTARRAESTPPPEESPQRNLF
ncbi:Sensory transduction histidine kinase [Sterolibacterium denitrificans]|uniref:Sensory transduction histidine kinase n=1 Tax=Sterolibacterium denitrificans TaxID=157592 RepID=A0A7Z7MUU3_9PROT|nr:Sensory transduction histidine kinase [Sterolibacterium denitrificans]